MTKKSKFYPTLVTRSNCDGFAFSQPSRVTSMTSISCDELFDDAGSSPSVVSSSWPSLCLLKMGEKTCFRSGGKKVQLKQILECLELGMNGPMCPKQYLTVICSWTIEKRGACTVINSVTRKHVFVKADKSD